MFFILWVFKAFIGKGNTMESRVGVLRPEIMTQIESQGAETVFSNWQVMAKVMRRKAKMKPEASISQVARKVAEGYEQEAELIAKIHGL